MTTTMLKESTEDYQKNKYLTFKIGEETFAFEIQYVTEIVGLQPVTPVPELPNFIKGIINLRGIIFPVMDARSRFKQKEIKYNDRTCIIVIDVNGFSMGLIVDQVSEVMDIEEANIMLPPTFEGMGRKFVQHIGKSSDEVILILDCNQLLDTSEISKLEMVL